MRPSLAGRARRATENGSTLETPTALAPTCKIRAPPGCGSGAPAHGRAVWLTPGAAVDPKDKWGDTKQPNAQTDWQW